MPSPKAPCFLKSNLFESFLARGYRAVSFLAACALLCLLAGCAGSPGSSRSVIPWKKTTVENPDVFLSAPAWHYRGGHLAVFPFCAPEHLEDASEVVTGIYSRELLRSRLFASVWVMGQKAVDLERALETARWKEQDTVLLGRILRILDASGAQPTGMTIRLQLLDTETGKTLWYLEQEAASIPGADKDFFWRTRSGEHAAGYKTLARELARQFAGLLALEDERS